MWSAVQVFKKPCILYIFSQNFLKYNKIVKHKHDLPLVTTVLHVFDLFSSAGVGRTGTFIALDYLLDKAREEGVIDVYGLTYLMRRDRVNMIQTVVSSKCTFFLPYFAAAVLMLMLSPTQTVKNPRFLPSSFYVCLTIHPYLT